MQKEMNGDAGILAPVREFTSPPRNGSMGGNGQVLNGLYNSSNSNSSNSSSNGSGHNNGNGNMNSDHPSASAYEMRESNSNGAFPHGGALTRTLSDRELEDISDDVLGPILQSPHLEVIGVTSALPREGKSTIALQLAASIARYTHKKVCLVDLGLLGGGLTERLHAESEAGVVDALEKMDYRVSIMKVPEHDGLVFIPGGKIPENPAKTAYSPIIGEFIETARQAFDVVIVDMPAIQTGYAIPIARQMDQNLLVVQSGVTPRDVVNSAIESVGRDRVMGVVLNKNRVLMPRWLHRLMRPFG
jgi:Mrp family chromosome partitioning ATPase